MDRWRKRPDREDETGRTWGRVRLVAFRRVAMGEPFDMLRIAQSVRDDADPEPLLALLPQDLADVLRRARPDRPGIAYAVARMWLEGEPARREVCRRRLVELGPEGLRSLGLRLP